ncbi:MAG: bifunctional (p)ppGpp synthetase/guanosine-3',5'-bis(diphosphate) 3'-pyrophosphohydrolase, partial [Muribaculaceae bacterium]|nr:bifunctional (p)ppGpp synthetase/guanosine-3',5'-bis(diphosphate) 3'-pyrophosphohydrolase [Muribaculaceae bacterium]
YVDDDNKVVVHKLDCPVAMRLKSSYGSRLVQTRWETKSEKFLAAIRVEGIDRMGILQEIIYIISTTMAINMRRLNISADDGLFRCDLVVLVEDANVITNLCKRLKRVKGVKIAERT